MLNIKNIDGSHMKSIEASQPKVELVLYLHLIGGDEIKHL